MELSPKYKEQELRNKLAVLGTRALVQKAAGERVDDKVRNGLQILKGGYPKNTEDLKSFAKEDPNLRGFEDVFDDVEK